MTTKFVVMPHDGFFFDHMPLLMRVVQARKCIRDESLSGKVGRSFVAVIDLNGNPRSEFSVARLRALPRLGLSSDEIAIRPFTLAHQSADRRMGNSQDA
jgi:hypothetical protein